MAIEIALVEPEIPANTGNISRSCVSTASALHLVGTLGFSLSERYLKRAGLDYWDRLELELWQDLPELINSREWPAVYYATTKGARLYTEVPYPDGSLVVFGKETHGLPESLLLAHPERCIRIPMVEENRSLNLSNSVAIVMYEALRTQGFPGMLGKSAWFESRPVPRD